MKFFLTRPKQNEAPDLSILAEKDPGYISPEQLALVEYMRDPASFNTMVPMSNPNSPVFERAYGFNSTTERRRKINSALLFAGCGGGGQTWAITAAKEGYGHFVLADPDEIDDTNIERLIYASPSDIGRNKAEFTAEMIKKHNPSASVVVLNEGVTKENVGDYMRLFSDAEKKVAIDEIDINHPEISVMYAREARKAGLHNSSVIDIGKGGIVRTYHPNDLKYTFEALHGMSNDVSLEYVAAHGLFLNHVGYLPKNGDLKTWLAVSDKKNKAPMPTTLPSVLTATALGLDELERILFEGEKGYKHRPVTYAPKERYVDPSLNLAGSTKNETRSYRLHLLKAIISDLLGKNPAASYGLSERQARDEYRKQYQIIATNILNQ